MTPVQEDLWTALARATDPQRSTCTVDECGKPITARGWCHTHYMRWKRTGTIELPVRIKPECSISGCHRPAHGRGYCKVHHSQLLRGHRPHRIPDAVDRFLMRCKRDPETGCWEWQGVVDHQGYGKISTRNPSGGSQGRLAHRFAYEVLVGPIPDGLTLDHLCRNRRCVCPSHLDPCTLAENISRIPNTGPNRTHCRFGHELTAENTLLAEGTRKRCRICARRRDAEYRGRRRARAA